MFTQSAYNPWQIAYELKNRGLHLGTNTETKENLYLPLEDLFSHTVIWGPPGKGKTNLVLNMFERLIHIPNATVILGIQKGDAGAQARDLVIASGQAHRLIVFDPGDPEFVCGFNPLQPNGLTIATHAKQIRESLLAAWNQHDVDQTPLLARYLFLSLYIARELELTIATALAVLRDAQLRQKILPRLSNPHVRDALKAFDALPERLQSEQVSSSLSRLESFVLDPGISRILNDKDHSLDFAAALKQHKIAILNIELYRPFRPADCSLLSKLLTNSLVSTVFERPKSERSPVFLLLDEATWVSEDLCQAIQLGRELKLSVSLSHQHPNQLLLDDRDPRLRDAIMECTRTKIIFSGLSVKIMRELTEEVMLDQYDHLSVKDEITSLELEPIESTRKSHTRTHSHSRGHGLSMPESETMSNSEGESYGESNGVTDGVQESKSLGVSLGSHVDRSETRTTGKGHGRSVNTGTAETKTYGWAHTKGRSEAYGESEGEAHGQTHGRGQASGTSQGSSFGFHDESGFGMTLPADGESSFSYSSLHGVSSGGSDSSSHSESTSDADSHSQSRVDTHVVGTSEADTESGSDADTHSFNVGVHETESEALTEGRTEGSSIMEQHGTTQGVSRSREHGESHTDTTTRTRSVSRGVTPSVNEEEGWSEGETVSPFYEYKKRRAVSSRTFLTEQEFLTLGLQKIQQQPIGHCVIKKSGQPAIFARIPLFTPPQLSSRAKKRARERIFAQPYYTKITEIEFDGTTHTAVPLETQGVSDHHHANRDPYTHARKPKRAKTTAAS